MKKKSVSSRHTHSPGYSSNLKRIKHIPLILSNAKWKPIIIIKSFRSNLDNYEYIETIRLGWFPSNSLVFFYFVSFHRPRVWTVQFHYYTANMNTKKGERELEVDISGNSSNNNHNHRNDIQLYQSNITTHTKFKAKWKKELNQAD